MAVKGATIPTFGKHSLTLNLGLRRTFKWVFVITNLHIPIIGADFLCHCSLLVDITNSQLVNSITQLKVQGILSQVESPRPSFFPSQHITSTTLLFSNLTSVATLLNTTFRTTFILMALMSMHNHTDWLLKSLKAAHQELEHMLEQGVICPSSSQWASRSYDIFKTRFSPCIPSNTCDT